MAGDINPEGAIDAIKTILTSDMAAKITALDTEYSASGNEALDAIDKIWIAPQMRYQEVPAVVIVALSSRRREDLGSEDIYQHDIALELILRSSSKTSTLKSAELLTIKLQRTLRAITEVLEAKRKLTVSAVEKCDHLRFRDTELSELVEDDNIFEKRGQMTFEVFVST